MKVLMITGSSPPDACGVGDYTFALTNELKKQGFHIVVSKLSFLLLLKLLWPVKNRVIHLQYPTQGYGYSFLPLLLVFLKKPIITLHEYSQVHPLRKLLEVFMLLFSRKIIVTTDHEKAAVTKISSNIKRKTLVVPVFSAFTQNNRVVGIKKRNGIIFFGLMRPNKGLEAFIELAQLLKQSDCEIPVSIYSAIPKGGNDYFEMIQKLSVELNINWHINKELGEVSRGMLSAKYAYLDFPDGVSERRSSFMAAISHGLVVFSKSGSMTPQRLKGSFVNAQTVNQVKDKINFYENNIEEVMKVSESAKLISENYSVNSIAKIHGEIYSGLLKV